jgi:seryl-tRNA synthetase
MQLVGYNKRMVDLKFIREYPEKVKRGSASKNVEIDVDKILQIDDKIKNLNVEVQTLRAERNVVSKERNIERGREIKQQLDGLEPGLAKLQEELADLLSQIPAIPKDDVKVGKNDTENDVVRQVGVDVEDDHQR